MKGIAKVSDRSRLRNRVEQVCVTCPLRSRRRDILCGGSGPARRGVMSRRRRCSVDRVGILQSTIVNDEAAASKNECDVSKTSEIRC